MDGEKTPAQLIDACIEELNDWRGAMLARVRALIQAADPEVVETWKWRGVPVWEHATAAKLQARGCLVQSCQSRRARKRNSLQPVGT